MTIELEPTELLPGDLHTHHSVYREKMLEHTFIAELLQAHWVRGRVDLEVLRAETDANGYDLVLARGPVIRHVQLKSCKGKPTDTFPINIKLSEKPAGCVVLIVFIEDAEHGRLSLEYSFFGGSPCERLSLDSFPIARRTTPNADKVKPLRPNIRKVPKKAFQPVNGGILGLIELLFGND